MRAIKNPRGYCEVAIRDGKVTSRRWHCFLACGPAVASACFERGELALQTADAVDAFLDRVALQEAVELGLLAPPAAVVVEVHGAGRGVDHHRVSPAGQLQDQAPDLAAEELADPFGRLDQAQARAGGADGGGVADLGL